MPIYEVTPKYCTKEKEHREAYERTCGMQITNLLDYIKGVYKTTWKNVSDPFGMGIFECLYNNRIVKHRYVSVNGKPSTKTQDLVFDVNIMFRQFGAEESYYVAAYIYFYGIYNQFWISQKDMEKNYLSVFEVAAEIYGHGITVKQSWNRINNKGIKIPFKDTAARVIWEAGDCNVNYRDVKRIGYNTIYGILDCIPPYIPTLKL